MVALAASRSPALICASASAARTRTSFGLAAAARFNHSTPAATSFSRNDNEAMRIARGTKSTSPATNAP